MIAIRGYGAWLHGDQRGSIDADHNEHGSPPITPDMATENINGSRRKTPAVTFDACRRTAIEAGDVHISRMADIRLERAHEPCPHRDDAPKPPERVMNVLKS
jgi:hypothetical protein